LIFSPFQTSVSVSRDISPHRVMRIPVMAA
jgi:hypothetical protein